MIEQIPCYGIWVSMVAIKLKWGILLVQANCFSRQPGCISTVFVSLCKRLYGHDRSGISSDPESWFVDAGNEGVVMGS